MDELLKMRHRESRLATEMLLAQKALRATASLCLHLSASTLVTQLAWAEKTRSLWNRTHNAFDKLFETTSKDIDASSRVTDLLWADELTQINLLCNQAMRKEMCLQQKHKETLDDSMLTKSMKAIVQIHCGLLKHFLQESRKWGLPPAQVCGVCSACRIHMPRRLTIGQFDLIISMPTNEAP